MSEIEQIDQTGEEVNEDMLKTQLALPGHDFVRDRWVAVSSHNDEQMIGFSWVWNVPHNNLAYLHVGVHPIWRRGGIGSELLRRTVIQAQTHHAQIILVYADTQHQQAKEFLLKHAFSPVASYTSMKLASSVELPQSAFPTEYSLHKYNPTTDFSLLLDMYNRAFQGLWGHQNVTAEELNNILEATGLEGTFLLFTQGGEAIGICRGEISEYLSNRKGTPTGYLDAPGVVPGYRSKNLYLPMLLHSANWVRSQAQVDIEMESWGDDPQVVAQYQQVGFEVMHQQDIYRWKGN